MWGGVCGLGYGDWDLGYECGCEVCGMGYEVIVNGKLLMRRKV